MIFHNFVLAIYLKCTYVLQITNPPINKLVYGCPHELTSFDKG